MKLFALIWSIYILALSVLPCNDAHTECYHTKHQTTFTQNHNHVQNQDDNCSPFCLCACCGAVTINLDFTPIQIHIIYTATKKITTYFASEKIILHKISFISNFFGNIWHPPKI